MKKSRFWNTLVPFLVSILHSYGNIQLQEHITESCYGRTVDDYLEPNCTSDEVLYIRDVYTYAKRLDMNCPQEAGPGTRNESVCCRYKDAYEDCGMRYYSTSLSTHYTNCVGRVQCMVPVAWNNTLQNCNQSVFMDKTNYMRQYYHCIPSASIANICNNPTIVGNPLYIWNDGYPSVSGTCATNSGCKCTVTSTNNSPIKVDVFDVRFQGAPTCLQRLHVKDGTSESEINCDDTNDFARVPAYTSKTNNIEVRYDDTATSSGGNFWLSLEATVIGSSLAINCSKTTAVHTCSAPLPTLPTVPTTIAAISTTMETTTATTETTSHTTTTTSTTIRTTATTNTGTAGGSPTTDVTYISTGSNSTSATSENNLIAGASEQEQDLSENDKTGLTVGAVIGALSLAAMFIAAGVIWKKWKNSKNKVDMQQEYTETFESFDAQNVAPVKTGQYKADLVGTYRPLSRQ